MKYNLILQFILALMLSLPHTASAETKLDVQSVQLSSKKFNPANQEKIIIKFNATQAAEARTTIFNSLGDPIRSLPPQKLKKRKTAEVVWDGKDDQGNIVGAGAYYYTITLEHKGQKIEYNPYRSSHGQIINSVNAAYNSQENKIVYDLPQAAMVRIRVNIKEGGPIMGTPLDWTPQPAGTHSLDWDGKDASGLIDLSDHPRRYMLIFAYSLADNAVIVEGEKHDKQESFAPLTKDQMAAKPFPIDLPADRYFHAQKDPRLQRVARLSLEFPNSEQRNGMPVLKDNAQVRAIVDPRDQWIVENSRYELMFFVDTVVIFEDESGFAPFTYLLKTEDLTEGEHILTVNLLTYDDQYATISQKVYVQHEEKNK